jgi:hypothetical protein
MLMIDCCSGLGGASQAMVERGWDVVTVDNNPVFDPDYLVDIRSFRWDGPKPDLVWCSPPCTEFCKDLLPWNHDKIIPDMLIVLACKDLIDEIKPRYWVIENVRGAIKWFRPVLGNPYFSCKPYFLWGSFPDISHIRKLPGKRTHNTSANSARRAKIPHKLSMALALAIEQTVELPMIEEDLWLRIEDGELWKRF